MKAFVDKGASIVTGYYGNILTKVIANPMTLDLIADLGGGLSFDESFILEDTGIRQNYCFPWVVDSPFYLVNPYPTNLKKTDISDSEIEFSWYQAPNLGTYSFDVYLNGELIKTTYDKSIKYKGALLKDNSWYVVANLLEFNLFSTKIWASYQSETAEFSITESSDQAVLVSRTYGGKTYSILRKDITTSDYRMNGDGSKFYPCSFSVKVDDKEYELPGSFYSYQNDRPYTDMGPVLAVNSSTGEMNVFFIEKDVDEYYGMCGYIFTLNGNNTTQWTLFTGANFGWFPYFERAGSQLLLNIFSYAGYFSIIGYQDEDWTLYYNEEIYPDDFKALQQQNDLILIY